MKKSNQAKAEYTEQIPSTPLRFVWYSLKPYKWWFFLGLLLNAVVQVLNTYVAVFIGDLANQIPTISAKNEFLHYALIYLGLLAAVMLLFRIGGFVIIHYVLKQQIRAHQLIKQYLLQHSHTYFINRFAGTLAGKLFHAGDESGEVVIMINYGFVRLFVSFIATGVVVAIFSVWLAIGYTFILLVSIGVNYYLVKRRRPHIVAYANATSRYRGLVTDVVTNIQATRQFSATHREGLFLDRVMDERITKDRSQWTMSEWNHVVNNVLTLALMTSMIGGTYILFLSGSVTIGVLVTVMLLMYRISGLMLDLGDWMNRMVRVYGEVEEGLEEIMKPHEIVDEPDAKKLKVDTAKIEWKGVDFQFDQNQVFAGFDLVIESGQRVGLVGPSGAGKTTFVSLLLRQHDIDTGSIEIDGQDISKVTQDSLRQNIAVVPQEPMLFHRTIRENIAYGKPKSTQKEIEEVAKKAQAHDFIMSLPERYNTLVGERGVKLSGGQKQRVAIARAMLKDAPILVLDEATSALDSESEVAIQKALHTLMEGKTVIAVAHRLSTLREMDRILVLEEGKVLEDGTHTELTNAGGTYQKLWEHQAGGFLQE